MKKLLSILKGSKNTSIRPSAYKYLLPLILIPLFSGVLKAQTKGSLDSIKMFDDSAKKYMEIAQYYDSKNDTLEFKNYNVSDYWHNKASAIVNRNAAIQRQIDLIEEKKRLEAKYKIKL